MRRKPLFPPPHHPTTGKRLANKGLQSHRVLTVNGEIKIVRRWWHGPQIGSVAPADAILDRGGATITPGVIEMACQVNLSATSFVRAAAVLDRTAQLKLSGERLRQVVEAAGRRVLQAQQDNTIAVAWHAEDCVVAEDGKSGEKTRIYTGCDGVMVPIITDAEKIKRRDKVKAKRRLRGKKCKPLPPRKRGSDRSWKEFKVAFFYSEGGKYQHVAFTHGNHLAAGKLLRREANRLRFAKADERVGLVDGATWICHQMQLHFAELDALGLDFYHLSENVHRARRKVFGEESPEGKAWADELMHVFKHEGCAAAWERLLPWRSALRGKAKREAADRLLHFVSARKDMIRYPEFREHGWQIGSGPTESQCKLCTKRLKGHGRRWDRPNATAVAALDTLARNGQWHQVWPNARPVTT
jgi:predicted HAD superfamily Cof-like phosphohydrolase